ncbi:hypothetical protein DPMN_059361 [Dreissena polymorpha]|uniref:Uncharacterized protein n=1 Tax=Dreissena polymorpha TaxID=45954 RepID=A0A9D4C3P6_DREPO|nr:hypothetical protein DPMN_059361 [Dreissena polymorpha]
MAPDTKVPARRTERLTDSYTADSDDQLSLGNPGAQRLDMYINRSSIFFLKVKGLSFSITKEGGCGGVGTGDGLVVSSKGAPGLVMGPCIVEIDRIVITEVQCQLEVNRCRNEEVIVKGNFGWVWPMWAGRPRVGNGAMHNVQYQLEVNWCRNEEIIVKGNFGWEWPMWAGHPRIDRIVITEVQYQLEMNRCRNEEVLVKGNFGWVWPM